MIKQILVPLDGSHAAEAVLPYVERIAAATNSSVLLLAAVDRARDWGEDTGGDLKGERHEAESYLRRLQARLTSSTGRDVELEVIESEPAAGILAKSEKHQPGLIAMTTHGRSGLARWVLGSVAAKLLHATHTPILVVRPPHDAEQTVPSLTKILVPWTAPHYPLRCCHLAETSRSHSEHRSCFFTQSLSRSSLIPRQELLASTLACSKRWKRALAASSPQQPKISLLTAYKQTWSPTSEMQVMESCGQPSGRTPNL